MKPASRTRSTFLGLTALTLSLAASGARGAVVPAESNSGRIPDIPIWDEANQKASLWETLQGAGSGPVIVLPVYTRCAMSCPVLTHRLKQEAARLGDGALYRVLVFSFDPSEDAQSLRAFREREQLPAKWMLVRAGGAEIQRFCDFFHYPIMTDGAVLVHANQVFLLEHDLHWRATLVDVDWDAVELRKWMGRAESPGVSGWVAMNPEKLAWIGLSGLSLGLVVTVSWLIWRRPSGRSVAPSA